MNKPPLVLAGLAGFVSGALVTGGIWLGTSVRSNVGDEDAAASCAILTRIDAPEKPEDLTRGALGRIAAASELAAAAAEEDAKYEPLREKAESAVRDLQEFDLKGAAKSFDAARDEC